MLLRAKDGQGGRLDVLAVILTDPMVADYGGGYWSDRNYECRDPEGHHWWFWERLQG